jgi:GT2 family glycosyltransferase
MIAEPKVGVVIVNWNKKDCVIDLIKSLKGISYNKYDIIVVDNASTDGSVDAIKNLSGVKLICNQENSGGTGGFNTGIKFVLEQNCYEYVWLLDNDAQIKEDTLLELVKVIHSDPLVGVAGSMTLNPDNKDMVVDLGGYVSWKYAMCKPYLNNQPIPTEGLPSVVEVDYTPACSALVRVEAIQKTGVMDERYFLHWDDIDLCLRISQAGYKVVSVSSSRIYHETEKGVNPVVAYYDVRNGLLTISKYLKASQRIIAIHNILRRCCKFIVLSHLTGLHSDKKPAITAIIDFIKGRFYGNKNVASVNKNISAPLQFDTEKIVGSCNKRILILPNGSVAQITKAWNYMESLGCENLFLLIQDFRKGLFPNISSDRVIPFDNKNSSWKALKLLVKIAAGKYAFAVSPISMTLPFSYAVKNCLYFESESKQLYQSHGNMKHFWKTIISFFAGETIALALLPIVYTKSKKYYMNRPLIN